MSQPQTSPLESFWRATIMLGTLVVGGMALYVYGPPPEKAAEFIDQVASRIQELSGEQAEAAAGEDPAAAFPGTRFATAPLPVPLGAPPQASVASQEPPAGASGLVPLAPPLLPSGASGASVGSLKEQLAQLGAEEVQLEPWGADGTLYRLHFSALMAGQSGFRRHFDAIESSPTKAAASGLAALKEWRTASHWPIYR